MGEFLLSILGINAKDQIIYTRIIKHAKYKIGEPVSFYYPHGIDQKGYYRIYNCAYDEDMLRELIATQDPNVVDMDLFTRYQKERRDEDIYHAMAAGEDAKSIAYRLDWIVPAVNEAVNRHMARTRSEKQQSKIKQVLDNWDTFTPPEPQ